MLNNFDNKKKHIEGEDGGRTTPDYKSIHIIPNAISLNGCIWFYDHVPSKCLFPAEGFWIKYRMFSFYAEWVFADVGVFGNAVCWTI